MARKEISNKDLKELIDRYKKTGDKEMTYKEFNQMFWALIDYFERKTK